MPIGEYSPESQADLGFHVDDSQVTLNSTGGIEGSVVFRRAAMCVARGFTEPPDEPFEWHHRPGAVLHAGKNRHGVRPIWKGRRWSLIIWF